jgi:hypothetical protein
MSISQGLIHNIVVTDCLFDLFMNGMQIICHVSSLDAQDFDARYKN